MTDASRDLTFLSTASNELEFTSTVGCFFKFSVSLDTAALANGPVTCTYSSPDPSLVYTDTLDSFTATTTDGHLLTFMATGHTRYSLRTHPYQDCTWTALGSAAR